MSFSVLTSKTTGVQFYHILKRLRRQAQTFSHRFQLHQSNNLYFNVRLPRDSKDLNKEHMSYVTFCKIHFFRKKKYRRREWNNLENVDLL